MKSGLRNTSLDQDAGLKIQTHLGEVSPCLWPRTPNRVEALDLIWLSVDHEIGTSSMVSSREIRSKPHR